MSSQQDFNRAQKIENDRRSAVWIEKGFVPKHHVMDPETELLAFAVELQPGMVVLIEDDQKRVDLYNEVLETADWQQALLRKYSRWMRVKEIYRCTHEDGNYVTILGGYEDGTTISHHVPFCATWFVKKPALVKMAFVPFTAEDLSDPKAGADKIIDVLREMGVPFDNNLKNVAGEAVDLMNGKREVPGWTKVNQKLQDAFAEQTADFLDEPPIGSKIDQELVNPREAFQLKKTLQEQYLAPKAGDDEVETNLVNDLRDQSVE
jgi:hypothetical protein